AFARLILTFWPTGSGSLPKRRIFVPTKRICRQHLPRAGYIRERQSRDFAARLSKEIAEDAATGYGNCSPEAKAVFSTTGLSVKDDLDRFHERNMASDPEYAIARQPGCWRPHSVFYSKVWLQLFKSSPRFRCRFNGFANCARL